MSLAEGLNRVMASRGLATRDVLARLGVQRDRATIYRVLAGQTVNPRLDTLLSLCSALDTTPDELLDQSNVFDKRPRSVDALDLRLRIAFRQMQTLPAGLKPAAIAQVLFLAESWKRAAEGRPVDDLLNALAEHERVSHAPGGSPAPTGADASNDQQEAAGAAAPRNEQLAVSADTSDDDQAAASADG